MICLSVLFPFTFIHHLFGHIWIGYCCPVWCRHPIVSLLVATSNLVFISPVLACSCIVRHREHVSREPLNRASVRFLSEIVYLYTSHKNNLSMIGIGSLFVSVVIALWKPQLSSPCLNLWVSFFPSCIWLSFRTCIGLLNLRSLHRDIPEWSHCIHLIEIFIGIIDLPYCLLYLSDPLTSRIVCSFLIPHLPCSD